MTENRTENRDTKFEYSNGQNGTGANGYSANGHGQNGHSRLLMEAASGVDPVAEPSDDGKRYAQIMCQPR